MPYRPGEAGHALIFPTLLAGTWAWRGQLPVLAARGFKVREFGPAYVNAACAPNLEAVEAYCGEMLEACPGRAVLIGNSLGGLIAMRLAVRSPEKVAGIVVSGSPGIGPMPNLGIGTKAMLSPNYVNSLKHKLFVYPEQIPDADERHVQAQISNKTAAKAGVRLARSLRDHDIEAVIPRLAVPTSMIWGRQDCISSSALWREAARCNPWIDFHEIVKSGHSPMYETPGAFNALLSAFLDERVAAPAARSAA